MYATILTTIKNQETKERIITALLEQKLVACIQEQEIKSHYSWQGKVEHESETLLVLKTKANHFDAIEACIQELHEYDLPEIVMLPITKGSQQYLQWIDEVMI